MDVRLYKEASNVAPVRESIIIVSMMLAMLLVLVLFLLEFFRLAFVLVAVQIARKIFVVVPALLHKIDRLTAGGIPPAILAPILLVYHRHVKVDWPLIHSHGRLYDDHRLRIDHRWWRIVADVNATVNAWLIDVNGYPDIGPGKYRNSCAHSQREHNELLHIGSPSCF